MTILALYFSGTGNTKFVVDTMAEEFKKYDIEMSSISIEDFTDEDIDKIKSADRLLFAYPVYGSMAPMIMWRFVRKMSAHLEDKKTIVIATQLMFSGDGGAYLARLLRKGHAEIESIEHFNMPSNLADVKLFKVRNGEEAKMMADKTRQRIELYCMDYAKNIRNKKGDGVGSLLLGALQRVPFSKWERKLAKNVKIDHSHCSKCGICVESCPTKNLNLVDNQIAQNGDCTLCYRCVNNCPEKVISILSKKSPKEQYKGIPE